MADIGELLEDRCGPCGIRLRVSWIDRNQDPLRGQCTVCGATYTVSKSSVVATGTISLERSPMSTAEKARYTGLSVKEIEEMGSGGEPA